MGRFTQPDTIVPEPGNTSTGLSAGPQALNRYSYVLNNPLRYVDSSGHIAIDSWGGGGGGGGIAVVMAVSRLRLEW